MIDGIESLCEVKRNDQSKTTIVKITKHNVRNVKQFRRRVVKSMKIWQEGRTLKLKQSIKLWEADILSFERKEESKIRRRKEGEEGLLVLGMERTIECFQQGKVWEKEKFNI